MKPVRVGLLGLGTVGGGTVNVIGRNGEEIARRAGRQIEITRAAVRSLDAPRICNTTGIDVTTDTRAVAVDPDVDVIVELMGGTELARELVLEAVGAGKHVVTANKALIAENLDEIHQLCKACNPNCGLHEVVLCDLIIATALVPVIFS